MRVSFAFLVAACALALPGCTPPQAPAPASQPEEAQAPSRVRSSGVVVAITPEYNAITIEHVPIPEYNMGAMTMEFTVDEASDLEGVNVGDRVSFELSGPIDIATITREGD